MSEPLADDTSQLDREILLRRLVRQNPDFILGIIEALLKRLIARGLLGPDESIEIMRESFEQWETIRGSQG